MEPPWVMPPNHGDPKSQNWPPRKSQDYFTSFTTTLPQEAQMPPQQACEEIGPLAPRPQPHNWKHPELQSWPGLPVPAGGDSRPHLLPPSFCRWMNPASWPPAPLFPLCHHHPCPRLLGNPALFPGPLSPSIPRPGSDLCLTPQARSAITI